MAPTLSLYHLPEEMVMEILVRLPTKSLIRFKSACKPWGSFISNPRCLVKHLLPDDHDNFLLVKRRDITSGGYDWRLVSDGTLDHLQSLFLPRHPDIPNDASPRVEIVGSCCNGLVCIAYYHYSAEIVIWNPGTGGVRFPSPSDAPYPREPSLIYTPDLGFLYDSHSQDYKVIRITEFACGEPEDEDGRAGVRVDIYSYNADCWKAIDVNYYLPCIILGGFQKVSVHTNGVFSWWAYNRSDVNINSILWFRTSDESFGTTSLPPNRYEDFDSNDDRDNNTNLLALNDQTIACIVYVQTPEVERCFRVWALLEFGVEDSWTPLFVIGPLMGIERPPIWFWKHGKMIMENIEGDLVLCDPFTYETKSLNIGKFPCDSDKLDTQIVSIPAKYISSVE